MVLSPLPIDEHLPHILESVRTCQAVVVEASPGAGKTTRLPSALLALPQLRGTILVSEPRRIAARLAATRVTEERGTTLGDEVGYRVRFSDKTSKKTRLVFVTEGLLLKQLLDDPELASVSAVVLDEVHERSADLDLCLALLKNLLQRRPELRVIAMSATLEGEVLSNYLGSSPSPGLPPVPAARHRSEGRSFTVQVEHEPKPDERPLTLKVRSAVKRILSEKSRGDILVFLPGGGEIRACLEALRELPEIVPLALHGDLPFEEQAKVMRPGTDNVRRVILSTNLAESSVTIPGIVAVVDTGLARAPVFDPWSGVSRLATVEISRARLVQRAGRAGRLENGLCLRLFTRGNEQARPAQDAPEFLRSDLSAVLLRLRAANLNVSDLSFLSAPPDEAWEHATSSLTRLGALGPQAGSEPLPAQLTAVGRVMAQLPLPPRLARTLVAARSYGQEEDAAVATALLEARDVVLGYRGGKTNPQVEASDSDVEDRIARVRDLRDARFSQGVARNLNLDVHGVRQVLEVAAANLKVIRRLLPGPKVVSEHGLSLSLLLGFPDRVASRRGNSRQLVLASGTQAELSEQSGVQSPLLLALSADGGAGGPGIKRRTLVRMACRIEPDWLLDLFPDEIETSENYAWNSEKERVEVRSRMSFGRVVLDETTSNASPSEATAEVLVAALRAKGRAVYDPEDQLEDLFVRAKLLAKYVPEALSVPEGEESDARLALLSALKQSGDDRDKLAESFEVLTTVALSAVAATRRSLTEMKDANLVEELLLQFPESFTRALRTETPSSVRLPSGLNLQVHYEPERTPFIESRLQDFFSLHNSPSICRGRVPLQIHLLSPNRRAVQVTTDLAGFWERHYPDVRKQLMRKYPKHLWPEDGRRAAPPTPGKIR